MRIKALILIFFYAFFNNAASSQKSIPLISNGKSSFKIVIAADATDIEKKAANTLQEYLFKISKYTLPIIQVEGNADECQIIVGRTEKILPSDISDLGDDGILLKRIKNTLIITGGPRKGVLYSVFTFLEDYLGCQLYTSDDIEVPHKNTITLPVVINNKQIPAFSYRTTDYSNAFSHDYCDWRKLNYFYADWGLWVHSFKILLPPSEYFASHPEYFALINGKRDPVQPDLTDPNVLKIVIENLKRLIKANPTAKYWSLSQNDSPTIQEHCECAACKKLDAQEDSPQGSLLTFVNAVAKQFPDVIISTLAYGYSEKPPKYLKPGKNVMVMLTDASIKNRSKPIATQAADFNKYFKKWAAITNNLFIWDYTVQFAHVLLPFPNISTFQPNIQLFASGNTKFIFEEGHGNIAGELSELRCYLITKLMWNKNLNIISATNKFLNHYYGKAGAKCIRTYLTLLEEKANNEKLLLYTSGNLSTSMKTYLSAENIDRYTNIFESAFKNLDSNTVYWKRVLKEYNCVQYASLENVKYLLQEKDFKLMKNEKSMILLNDWYNKTKILNITVVNESRISVDDYYKNCASLLNGNRPE